MESMLIPLILGISGVAYNDVLALISLVGCTLMFAGSLPGAPRLLSALGEWSTAPLYFGLLFQIAIYISGVTPERIGFLVPMTPGAVDALFAVSVCLLAGAWWMKRKAV